MSRNSNDELDSTGQVLNGFDYDLQVWVEDGRVMDCGHKVLSRCGCAARKYKGWKLIDALTDAGMIGESDDDQATRQVGTPLDTRSLLGEADPEYSTRIDAARVTAEFKSAIQPRKPQHHHGDLPLFGGERQEELF